MHIRPMNNFTDHEARAGAGSVYQEKNYRRDGPGTWPSSATALFLSQHGVQCLCGQRRAESLLCKLSGHCHLKLASGVGRRRPWKNYQCVCLYLQTTHVTKGCGIKCSMDAFRIQFRIPRRRLGALQRGYSLHAGYLTLSL